MRSMEDKREVMLKKPELQRNPHFNKVFVDHDLSYADRVMSSNFRAVLKALNNQGLTVKGSRVIRSRDGSVDISSRDGSQRPPQQDQRSDDRDFRGGNWRQNSGGRGCAGGRGGPGSHGGRGRNGGYGSQGQRGGNRGLNSGPY
ncbi:heterogeneous nuclear ribonucleoproteins A1 homolog [Mya arenaria]|uniref:heterogeneous nuclear ribonucleoproteins A1 homolog n=1 Tax=Mya arenaria TaxID=6604 RepID=UPI0022E11349|nr:heterogeneous nuclear ribonucleoproteins A1 homolog [Mya arenaria]